MAAVAFSNNDIALVAWTFGRRLDGCMGFAVHQLDVAAGTERVLPALARFASQSKDAKLTTGEAPIQKFWWKDLFAKRGKTYRYRIVALGGTPGHLTQLAGVAPLLSNSVTLSADRLPFKAYFNPGIVASQAVAHALDGKPTKARILARVTKAGDDLRVRLMGQIYEGVTSLLDRADNANVTVNAALYELNDAQLEARLQAADHGKPKARTVILGNERIAKSDDGPEVEDADAENRQHLKDAGVNVIDRILPRDTIPHNKFMVLNQPGKEAVLTGSTNWTSTGLCTQTNNALVIESPRVAARYSEYWGQLATDLANAAGDQKKLQSAGLRTWARKNNAKAINEPIALEDGSGTIEVMFSPSTEALLKRPPKETPNDMKRLYDLVGGAKHAVLFLAFDPGNNSILDAAGAALRNKPDLFVRGALTSTQRAPNFAAALHRDDEALPGDGSDMHVAVIGEPSPKKKTGNAKAKAKKEEIEPDYRAIPAGAIDNEDAFGAWEKELYSAGHAIIHNKVVVIDPFDDDCTVIAGSHNLGYRASHNNDENMVIVRGHKPLAEAYACHVLDVYDHYAWRYWLAKFPHEFGRPLDETGVWQDRYLAGGNEKSPELRFWLSAGAGGVIAPAPAKPAAAKKTAGAKKKPVAKNKPAATKKKPSNAKSTKPKLAKSKRR